MTEVHSSPFNNVLNKMRSYTRCRVACHQITSLPLIEEILMMNLSFVTTLDQIKRDTGARVIISDKGSNAFGNPTWLKVFPSVPHKFMVLGNDDAWCEVVTGSGNFTGNIRISNEPHVVASYLGEFNRMFPVEEVLARVHVRQANARIKKLLKDKGQTHIKGICRANSYSSLERPKAFSGTYT